MNQERLWSELEIVASRYRQVRYWRVLAAAWLLAAGLGLLVWGLGRVLGSGVHLSIPLSCFVALLLAGAGTWLVAARPVSRLWVARRIESAFPELRSCLLAAIEQQPALPDGRFGYLQSRVIQEALEHARGHAWPDIVPGRRVAAAVVAQFAALGLFVAGLAVTALWPPPPVAAASSAGPKSGRTAGGFEVAVEPGDAEIERGSSLLVLARIRGPLPAEAALLFQPASGGDIQRLPMAPSLNDPVFGARIDLVQDALDYHVELDGRSTPTYHVTIFEYPKLERADARLVYPKYTGMEERLVQDVRTVSVVEGTEVTLICRLNKPVATARLIETGAAADKSPAIELVAASGDGREYQATIRPDKSQRLTLELVDDAGRHNVQQAELAIRVSPNSPAVIKVVFPARDLEVSPLQELDVSGTAWDDFGLLRIGLTYGLAGQEPVDVVLSENAAARERHEIAFSINLEALQAEPDQLLSYHFWGEDYGPDGAVRRSASDMYFAEVRHYEEIYRAGQSPPGGEQSSQQQAGGQNAQAAQKLADLQKQIINATWKLVRRETGSRPTSAFANDAEQVAQSQAEAREMADELADKLQDGDSLSHLATVLEQMGEAQSHLKSAFEGPALPPLRPALAAEQSAYQALLKLRAREHEIVRQQRQSGSAGASAAARSEQQRQQLGQLDLKDEENRYETQRQAQSQPQEDRETRQVLNRLSELARRQHDLNERLKDLQSALAEAAAPQQREEIRRQLKRLEEEQQQVLRDTDELQSRMETAENQERMSAERRQLEQTRDQVQRTSEALQEERVTQAAASGTRAEREFEELRNEFRRRAAGRFGQEMQHMREAARDLERREKELAEQLSPAENAGEPKSLRDDGRRERVAKGLAEQRQRLTELVDEMKRTIQEAEQTEPLLSERLYDAARDVQNRNVDKALQASEQSLSRGFVDDAKKAEAAAGRGISQLREGVEKAAESVLGDETEALRRARDELRNLADDLNREITRNSPAGAPSRETGGESSPENSRGQTGNAQADRQSQANEGPGRQRGRGAQRDDQQPPPPDAADRQLGAAEQPADSQTGEPRDGQPGTQEQQRGGDRAGSQQQEQPEGQLAGGASSGNRNVPNESRSARSAPRPGTPSLAGPADPTAGDGRGRTSAERVPAPITGGDFLDWSDRLRDVEEMVDDPELRAEAARIRDRARGIRAEVKRHSVSPNWNLVRVQVAEPLVELSQRVAEELLRRTSKQSLVPLDRDPVPPRYSERTRRYYENLGSGK